MGPFVYSTPVLHGALSIHYTGTVVPLFRGAFCIYLYFVGPLSIEEHHKENESPQTSQAHTFPGEKNKIGTCRLEKHARGVLDVLP